jgi:hypothetical protein
MRIGELTRQTVQTAGLVDTLTQAASHMRFADVSALIVTEAGRLGRGSRGIRAVRPVANSFAED